MNFSGTPIIDYYTTLDSSALSSSQSSLPNSSGQMSYWGFALVFVMVMGSCVGRWSLKLQKRKTLNHHQQRIQILEKIWKMSAHQKH